ncbi:MAG: GDSL-type esterase/lipase family protein [Vicinamibacterales bacterium]
MTRRLERLLLLLLASAACTTPVDPTPQAPTLSCPAPQTVASADGSSVTVSYASPTATGGTAPLGAPSCTPASGSKFPVGSTMVECTVRDAEQQAASCGFTVRVTAPPTLTRTRFMAFGDSLTEGKLSACPFGLRPFSFEDYLADIRTAVNVPFSYPTQLRELLSDRYTTQSPVVINEGFGGETIDEGLDRLPDMLSRHQPDVLLLLEGANDLRGPDDIPDLIDGLRGMVQQARSRGVLVYVGTLLPQRDGACRNFADKATILQANEAIKVMGFLEGALMVDLHAALAGKESTLLGPDGLHPSEAGYQEMAKAFFAAIRVTLEAPSGLGGPGTPFDP